MCITNQSTFVGDVKQLTFLKLVKLLLIVISCYYLLLD